MDVTSFERSRAGRTSPMPAGSDESPRQQRQSLQAAMAPFQRSSLVKSLWQLGSTMLMLIALDATMYACLHSALWLTFALAFPAAGMTVKLFIVQHDCGHGSFFRSRRANDFVGRFCSLATWTPYAFWRRQHANHHACFNNLDRRDTGIDLYSTCATVTEYRSLPRLRRWLYRVSRHPFVTQMVLPPIVLLFVYRVPFDASSGWGKERASVYLTNLAICLVIATLVLCLGVWPVMIVQLPVLAITSVIGMWLFSIQHRFEESHWARQAVWSARDASLRGSSYLKLPRILQWFTGNIGFHHVHHLAARIPNYRLQACHNACPELKTVTTLRLREALLAPCFVLWDEEQGLMARFPR